MVWQVVARHRARIRGPVSDSERGETMGAGVVSCELRKSREGRSMEQLGSLDAALVYLESKALSMHMGAVFVYDPSSAPGGNVSFSQILGNLERRMDAVAVFRRRVERVPLDLDHPWWVDDGPADLGYHVSRLALPTPADWREFCGQVARYLERPLDMSRPPWEMLFIEGLDRIEGMPKGAFALVQKMHHSAMDGVSGMEFIGCLHDQE